MSPALSHAALATGDLRRRRAAAHFGRTIHYYDSVDSTNTVARQLALNGAAEGTAVIAETQTRGRGRLGRAWVSPPFRNLYLSIILRPPLAAAEVAQITLVAGLATAEAAGEWAPGAAIKWPNDVVVGGRKLAGILAEMETDAEGVRFVILGIGVNLNAAAADFPPELRDKAVSLRAATGQLIDRVAFADRLLSCLEHRYDLFLRAGFAGIRPLWESHSSLNGRQVEISGGGQRLVGVVTGIADDGTLVLRDAAQMEIRVVAGDVTVLGGYEKEAASPPSARNWECP